MVWRRNTSIVMMFRWVVVVMVALLFLTGGRTIQAQEPLGRLAITGSDATSAPSIALQVLAVDGQGNRMDLAGVPLSIQHGGTAVDPSQIQVGGTVEAGTFTLFVLDVTEGVVGQLPAIQQAILQYAADPTMKEQVDHVAIYQVGETAARALLEPASFYNSIRNLFTQTPPAAVTGTTALVDSLLALLNNLEQQKPSPELAPALVVFSDGTDAVSPDKKGDVPRLAAEMGVPIHTVWLDNPNLPNETVKQEGRDYMNQMASATRGTGVALEDTAGVTSLWERIAAFRAQQILRYTVTNLQGGDQTVVVSLRDQPAVQDQATVNVPPAAPTVSLNIPPESREWTLPSLDEPVDLTLSAAVSWLDGGQRAVQAAQLLVNGVIVQEIDPTTLDSFDVSVNNFGYGPNNVQVAVVDDQGARATSPEIVVTINEGDEQLPEAVQPAGILSGLSGSLATGLRIGGGCLVVVLLLVLVALLAMAGRRVPLLRRFVPVSLLRRVPFLRPYFAEVAEVQRVGRQVDWAKKQMGVGGRYKPEVKEAAESRPVGPAGTARGPAFLEVMEAESAAPRRIELDEVELKVGRSPQQAHLAFENDITVSRLHATIVQEGSAYRIFDEQSTSGTWVNDQRVPEYGLQLMDGDGIRLGAVHLRFRQP